MADPSSLSDEEIEKRIAELEGTLPQESSAEVDAILQTSAPSIPRPVIRGGPQVGTMPGLLGQFGEGVLFGGSDEAQAGIRALLGGDFERERALIDARQQQFVAQNPGAALGANVAGAVAAPLTLPAKTFTAIPGISRLPKLLQPSAVGAISGGTTSALSASPGERIEAIPSGAGGGAIAGPLTQVGAKVVKGGTSVVRGIGRRFSEAGRKLSAEESAAKKLKRVFEKDKTTADRVDRRLKKLGDEAIIAEAAGEKTLGRARGLTLVSDRAANKVKVAANRQKRQAERLLAPVERELGDGSMFVRTFDELDDISRRLSRELYDTAYSINGTGLIRQTPAMQQILRTDAGQRAFRAARTKASNELPLGAAERRPPIQFPERPDQPIVMENWDRIKRALDDQISAERNVLTGQLTDEGRIIKDLKNLLLKELDAVNPFYEAARASYAGPARAKDMMNFGDTFIRQSQLGTKKVISERQLKRLSPQDRRFAMLGAANALRDIAEGSAEGVNKVRRLFQVKKMRDKIQAIMPTRRGFREFQSTAEAEAIKFQTQARLQGSRTAVMQTEAREAASDIGIAANIIGVPGVQGSARPLAAFAQINQKLQSFIENRLLSTGAADELAEALFTKDPATQAKVLARVRELEQIQKSLIPAIAGAEVSALQEDQ